MVLTTASVCCAASWTSIRSRCHAQAYRQGAKRLHPDKAAAEGVGKEAAEKAFHDLAEAYEVLLCGAGADVVGSRPRAPDIQCRLLHTQGHDAHHGHSAPGTACQKADVQPRQAVCLTCRCCQMRRSGNAGMREKILNQKIMATIRSGTCSRVALSSTFSGSTRISTNAVCSTRYIGETVSWVPHACLYFRGTAIASAELQKLAVESNDQMTSWRTKKLSLRARQRSRAECPLRCPQNTYTECELQYRWAAQRCRGEDYSTMNEQSYREYFSLPGVLLTSRRPSGG